LGRDVLIAVIVMVIIIGGLYGYTGNWPPMVVIESDSMMHGDDSNVGTIDTGDLVLVKSIDNRKDITTYVEGEKKGYKTYDSYGDVIIFKKNGVDDTPVIHRAVAYIVYNASGNNNDPQLSEFGSWDIPSMGLYNKMSFWIPDYQPNRFNLSVDLKVILKNFQRTGIEPHDGFIIKGDNNIQVDQLSDLKDSEGNPVEPVKTEWIVGKAQGELPWFGLIKLYISGETDEPNKEPPPTSVRMLVFSIALIIIIPIVLDVLFSVIGKQIKKRKEEQAKDNDDSTTNFGPKNANRLNPTGPGGINSSKKNLPDAQVRPQGESTQQRATFNNNNNSTSQQGITKDELLKKIK
jgi:signal peptidase